MTRVSTADVQPRAQAALKESPILELRVLRVQGREKSLRLCGRVSSFYHKQLAQEVVRAVCRECTEADIKLVNSIRVESNGESRFFAQRRIGLRRNRRRRMCWKVAGAAAVPVRIHHDRH